MKSQIQSLSQDIEEFKQNTKENQTSLLKQEIKNYIKNYGGESVEFSGTQIQTKENIKNLFEKFILEENAQTKEIEENILSNLEKINNNQKEIIQEEITSSTKEKTENIIGQTINSYMENKEISDNLKNLPIGQKLNLLKQINGENFKYKINNPENNNPEYKTISELTKQEKINLINKNFSNLNPKLELKILQEKRNSHQEGEENSYLHLNQNNGVIRNYYQINSNLKYLEKKLQNNEYINFPSLRKVYNKLEINYNTKKPVYLIGETGGGKTELAKNFLQEKINELHPKNKNKAQNDKTKITPILINSNEDTSSSELESTKELATEEFINSQGTKQTLVISKEISQGLKKGAEQGIPVILDEVNKMPQGTLGILNEYLSQVQDSGIYNGHSKVKKGFFVIMTGNEGENYLARNELDPSIKRRVDSIQYPYLDKKDLAYFAISQLNNFNKNQNKDQNKKINKSQNKQEIKAENNFDKSLQGLINGFNKIQKNFEENRYKEDGEEKDFIYKIPSPDIGTIKNIIKKYNNLNNNPNNNLNNNLNNNTINNTNNNKLNTTLEIQIFEDYIQKDIYNLDSQIYLFNIFKNNGLFKNFNDVIPQGLDNILNKSSEEKFELIKKIEDFFKEEKNNLKKQKRQQFTKTELIIPFHEELENQEEDELFKNKNNNILNLEDDKDDKGDKTGDEEDKEYKTEGSEIDLSEIDDITEIIEAERFKHATEKEKNTIKSWEEKYPEWAEKNLNKITFHEDGIEFNLKGLEGKKVQRENIKVEKENGELPKGVYEIPENKLNNLSQEELEKIKDEQLFTWDAAIDQSKKQGLEMPSAEQWGGLADFMPGESDYEKYLNLSDILDLKLSGFRLTDGNFYSQDSNGYYWSSTEVDSYDAWNRLFNSAGGNRSMSGKADGFSVRCIKG